jgi:hypothetical protein
MRAQSTRATLHEIAIGLLIEMVEEITDEDEIVLLVSQIVCQRIPSTMDDAFAHALLSEDRAACSTASGRLKTTEWSSG